MSTISNTTKVLSQMSFTTSCVQIGQLDNYAIMTLICTHLCKKNDFGSWLEYVGVNWFPASVLLQTRWATLAPGLSEVAIQASLSSSAITDVNTVLGNREAGDYLTVWALWTFPSLSANLKLKKQILKSVLFI